MEKDYCKLKVRAASRYMTERAASELMRAARALVPAHLHADVREEAAQAIAVDVLSGVAALDELDARRVRRYVSDAYGLRDAFRFRSLDALASTNDSRTLRELLEGSDAWGRAPIGHARTLANAAKRRAVETVLRDPEWSKWSDREIARRCAASKSLVGKIRRELSAKGVKMPTERISRRGGQTYPMKIDGITAKGLRRQREADRFDRGARLAA